MPSEKLLYLERTREPEAPVDFMGLKEQLLALGADHMAEILWIRAQHDEVLAKALMVSVGLLRSQGDWEKAKAAVDYALHFPDFVRYTEGGHRQILDEIASTLDLLVKQGQHEFALKIVQYAIGRGHEIAENFEDDWDWTCSLKNLEEWASKLEDGA